MKNKKILITGGSGLLSLNWAFSKRNECSIVLGLHERNINIKNTKSLILQLDKVDKILHVLDTEKPNIVITEKLGKQIVTIPLFVDMTRDEIEIVINAVLSFDQSK